MKLSSKRLNTEKIDEDPYYIYILVFDNYIMKNYIKYCIIIIIINKFIININTNIPSKLSFFTTLNFIQNIIIIRISNNNWMSLYCFLCFVPAKKFLRDVLYISYYDNIKTWTKYCACWGYNGLLKWSLFPIPIGVFLHGEKILWIDN